MRAMAPGQCVLVQKVYRVHATRHTRGMDNMAFTVRVDSVYDLLSDIAKLKAIGYAEVKTSKVGTRYIDPSTGEEVRA